MITVFKSNKIFLDTYLEFLETDEIKNNLMIGIAKKALDKDAYFVSSKIKDHLLLGVILGRKMIISSNTLCEDVYYDLVTHMENISYPGIIGERKECLMYQRIFEAETHKRMIVEMNQKIYKCNAIREHKNDEKFIIRLATKNDIKTLFKWYEDFIVSLEGPASKEDIEKALNNTIEKQQLFVLEASGKIVSMTAKSRETKNSQTVSMVYTPEIYRRKGYASILVLEVTKSILKNKTYATLYTDTSNPTSNSIYMKIGYELYCESLVLAIQKK